MPSRPECAIGADIGRTATAACHSKWRELVHQDLWHYEAMEGNLSGFDACFFCLGVSSSGMTEQAYEHVTYGITVAAAEFLVRITSETTAKVPANRRPSAPRPGLLASEMRKEHPAGTLAAHTQRRSA